MPNVTLLIAFGAGLASFLSPCVLPIVPAYFASLGRPVTSGEGGKTGRLPIFFHSLSFMAGFSAVFVSLGLAAGLAGFALGPYLSVIREISGSLLIALGVFMLAALKVPWLNYERHLAPSMGRTTGYLRSMLTGGVFSLAWTPCVGPILGGILTLAWVSETALAGAVLLAMYSLGLGIPFLILGAVFDFAAPRLRRLYRYSRIINLASGAVMIVIGVLILTNNLDWLRF